MEQSVASPPKPLWIAVVRNEGATVYSSAGAEKPLTVAYRVPNPTLKVERSNVRAATASEFEHADQPRGKQSGATHAGQAEDDDEDAKRRWALHLAHHLDWYCEAHAFDRLVLVGSLPLLERIRAALSDGTARSIVAELTQDLANPTAAELRHRLAKVIQL